MLCPRALFFGSGLLAAGLVSASPVEILSPPTGAAPGRRADSRYMASIVDYAAKYAISEVWGAVPSYTSARAGVWVDTTPAGDKEEYQRKCDRFFESHHGAENQPATLGKLRVFGDEGHRRFYIALTYKQSKRYYGYNDNERKPKNIDPEPPKKGTSWLTAAELKWLHIDGPLDYMVWQGSGSSEPKMTVAPRQLKGTGEVVYDISMQTERGVRDETIPAGKPTKEDEKWKAEEERWNEEEKT